MRYGLTWQLHCDSILSTTVGPGLVHFQTFLNRGAAGINDTTYLGADLPGRFCPNFGFHFKTVNNSWPTPANPLPHFAHRKHVSLDVQDYAIVTIDVHGNHPAPIAALCTTNEISAANHRTHPPTGGLPATDATAPPVPPANPPPPQFPNGPPAHDPSAPVTQRPTFLDPFAATAPFAPANNFQPGYPPGPPTAPAPPHNPFTMQQGTVFPPSNPTPPGNPFAPARHSHGTFPPPPAQHPLQPQ
jgi:hypothetical protein